MTDFNSKNESFENSLKKQIIEQKQEILEALNQLEYINLDNISETNLIVSLSKFKMFKFFINQLNQ